jgi:phosphatidylglycerol:prolipoprotein diacylglycerol transferase
MSVFHPYGLMIALATLVAYIVSFFRKKNYGFSSDDLDNLTLFLIPLGIIGARLYHVFDRWDFYQNNLSQIWAVWNGGLGIYGGIAGGVVGVIIFNVKRGKKLKTNHQQLITVFDFLMPPLAVGQAIGRWGNFLNHEVFGGPTDLPWKWYISENLRPEFWENYSYFHPTFLYESLWCFLGFMILIALESKFTGPAGTCFARIFLQNKKDRTKLVSSLTNFNPGLLTGFYTIWYGLGRFFLEFLRFDTAEIFGLKTAQIISLGLIILGVFLIKRAFAERV